MVGGSVGPLLRGRAHAHRAAPPRRPAGARPHARRPAAGRRGGDAAGRLPAGVDRYRPAGLRPVVVRVRARAACSRSAGPGCDDGPHRRCAAGDRARSRRGGPQRPGRARPRRRSRTSPPPGSSTSPTTGGPPTPSTPGSRAGPCPPPRRRPRWGPSTCCSTHPPGPAHSRDRHRARRPGRRAAGRDGGRGLAELRRLPVAARTGPGPALRQDPAHRPRVGRRAGRQPVLRPGRSGLVAQPDLRLRAAQPVPVLFDPASGRLLAGDVGWSSWEEVDRILAGGNYGWPCYEGSARSPDTPPHRCAPRSMRVRRRS